MVALIERQMSHERNPQDSPTAQIVIFDKNKEKVLLVRHSAERKEGLVGLPGGRPIIGSTETLIDAGIRELREETGFRTNSESLISYSDNVYLGRIRRESGDKYYSLKAFICTGYEGELRRVGKEGKVFWAKISKLDRYGSKLSPTVKRVVADSLNFLNNQVNG